MQQKSEKARMVVTKNVVSDWVDIIIYLHSPWLYLSGNQNTLQDSDVTKHLKVIDQLTYQNSNLSSHGLYVFYVVK